MYEKSLILLKPDAIQRHLAGTILHRFDQAGLKIHALKFLQVDRSLAEQHYAEHVGKVFFEPLLKFITSGPVIAIVFGGMGAISRVRIIVGATEPASAAPGTIRGDLAHQPYNPTAITVIKNLVHASANQEDAQREIPIWFSHNEIIDYSAIDDKQLGLS